MKDRINKIMETEGLSPAKFADEIGVQRSSISHILSGRNKPSYDFIIKIMNRFSGINAEWLLTGKGPMIKSAGQFEGKAVTQSSLFEQPIDSNPDKKSKQNAQNTGNINESENDKLPQTYLNIETNKGVYEKRNTSSKQFTNVNKLKIIMFFYDDGSFEQFIPRQ